MRPKLNIYKTKKKRKKGKKIRRFPFNKLIKQQKVKRKIRKLIEWLKGERSITMLITDHIQSIMSFLEVYFIR